MNNLTDNRNLLPLQKFRLVINAQNFSNTGYFAVTANIPDIQAPAAPANFKNNKGFVPGETLEYGTFNCRIAVDEDMVVYRELFDWMKSYTNKTGVAVNDMTLLIFTAGGKVNNSFKFVNAFPTSLGSLDFNVQNAEVEYAYLDVTFQYDYFYPEARGAMIC